MDLAWVQRLDCRVVWLSVGARGPAFALARAVIDRVLADARGLYVEGAEKADMGRLLIPRKRAVFLVWREVA